MEKVIRNGKVAVIYASSYGTQWSASIYPKEKAESLIFSPKVVQLIESGVEYNITPEWIEEHLGIKLFQVNHNIELRIKWLPIGTPFTIIEYDGSEHVITPDDLIYTT